MSYSRPSFTVDAHAVVTRSIRRWSLLGVLALLCSLLAPHAQAAPAAQPPAPPQPQATIQEAPTTMVSGGVARFTLAGPKLFWQVDPYCPPPQPHLTDGLAPSAAADPVTISRIATYGGEARTLFSRNDPRAPGVCNQYKLRSNIVADDSYVYWLDSSGLLRLSTNANPGDPPEVWDASFAGLPSAELALGSGKVFVLGNGVVLGSNQVLIATIDKATKAKSTYAEQGIGAQLKYDGQYLYWINSTLGKALRRLKLGETAATTLDTGVDTYNPDGFRDIQCSPYDIYCGDIDRVFYAKGSQLRFHENLLGYSSGVLYEGVANTRISHIASDQGRAFVFEERFVPCSPSPCFGGKYTDWLLRIPIYYGVFVGYYGGTPEALYMHDRGVSTLPHIDDMRSDGTFLFWQETESAIYRLAHDVAALPKINMFIDGMEITQGIQNSSNSVLLIQNRPTYVRIFAKSAGDSVPGVTARLYGSGTGVGGWVSPVNAIGPITVRANPDRLSLDQSFLFRLPWDWTQAKDLRLTAQINPFGYPLEPNYADNYSPTYGPFEFKPTPRLDVIFAEFGYTLNGTTYNASGTLTNVGWINRVYPLGASIEGGSYRHGLDYEVWEIDDAGLGARVGRSLPECDAYVKKKADGTIIEDNRELCASDYTNSRLSVLRSQRAAPVGTFIYGMISDSSATGGQFPRGQAGTGRISSGPDGPSWNGYYAGHEIGHSLGLGHPNSANTECGLDGSDAQPNYPHGHIGPDDGSVTGFDSADNIWGGTRAMLNGTTTMDMMAYCQPQWISDVNYKRIYDALPKAPSVALAAQPQVDGDWLSVYGTIVSSNNAAEIHALSRLPSVNAIPPRTPGGYSIRLRNKQGVQLADYPFTPDGASDGDEVLPFGQVVPFVASTAQVQIVRLSDGRVLAAQAISARPPVVSGVALQGASSPVSGTVTLAWTASDPDGDALTADILYSRDGGASFQPLRLGVAGRSSPIDASALGGGSAFFRVVVSDGAQTAAADSATFTMANKPPQPQISAPADGTRIRWGTVLNLSGSALDPQDGSLTGAQLVWSNQKGNLGSGPLLAVGNLPAGPNQITLTATNSAGLSASTNITVLVDDDLDLPGPTLAATPAEVGWSIVAGTTQTQTAQLSLANVGSGSLSWSAGSDAAWLKLGAASGSAPGTLTLIANPKGFVDGSVHTATVTFTVTGAGSPAQTVIVPVTMRVGNTGFASPPQRPSGGRRVLIPLVRR